jgi:uncharacterized membrane protein
VEAVLSEATAIANAPVATQPRAAARAEPESPAPWILGDDRRLGAWCLVVSALLITAYTAYFAHVTTDAYRAYGYRTFDLAIYDQGVWLLSRFHAPFVTAIGRNLFGDHAQYSLLALVPLYWVRPDATTLLLVQAVVLALGAMPVYLLAMRRSLGPVLATVLVAAFLLHPALGQSNLENYHPDSFLVPILGFAIYAAVERRPRLFVVCSALALLCKEDVVFVLLPIALWYGFRRDRRTGVLVAIASVVVAVVDTNVVMRSLVGVSTRNAFRIPFSTCTRACSVTRHVSDFAKTVLTKPATAVRYLLAGDRPNGRPFYAWQMVAPTGLAFLVSPGIAMTAALALAVNVLSTVSYQHQIAYHYSMELLPALFMGTVFAVSRIPDARRRAIAVAIVGCSAVASSIMWGAFPFSRQPLPPHASPSSAYVAGLNAVADRLPASASVSAYDGLLTHVDHRTRVYMWPTPFFASHWGVNVPEGTHLPEAASVEYLLLPTRLDDHPDVLRAIAPQFTEIARYEDASGAGAVLYRRVASRTGSPVTSTISASSPRRANG